MFNDVIVKRSIIVVLSTALVTGAGIAHAFDMCKNIFGKMNQSDWRGGYRERDYYRGVPVLAPGYGYRGRDYGYASPGYVYAASPVQSYGYRGETSESALEILDMRYATGEIDKQEYEEKKATIRSSR
jgi:hypothetical protein